MIREGTAARNLEALAPLLCEKYIERCMFCTDDKHPNDLLEKGHIDYICREAINKYGVDPIIATDADVPGQVAAQRDYWILTPQLLQPRFATLPDGSDPAELIFCTK